MKKTIVLFLLFSCAVLYASDYRWELINVLVRNNYPAAESLINKNVNSLSPQDKRLSLNLTLTYSRGDTTLKVLELLNNHSISPSSFDLYTAINMNHNDAVIQFIIDNGAFANGEILLLAMEKQRFGFARQFILAGADVNYHYPLARNYADGMTPLLYASRHDNLELVQLLVERGANVNARNTDGSTALSIAQTNGNSQITNFLLESGAVHHSGGVVQSSPQQSGGIAGFLNNQTAQFQPGSYRLSGGSREIVFTGNANFGVVGFIANNRTYSGSYQVSGSNISMTIEGNAFIYRMDSNVSFSGNGEVWVKIGN